MPANASPTGSSPKATRRMAPAIAQIASGKFQGRAITAAVATAAMLNVAVSEAIAAPVTLFGRLARKAHARASWSGREQDRVCSLGRGARSWLRRGRLWAVALL